MNELDYLLDTYFNKEDWHKERLSPESAEVFYRRQLEEKNIVFLKSSNSEKILGYLEIWWLDKEQLGRIINQKEFNAFNEDLSEGKFVFVASAYIEEGHRNRKHLHRLNQMMKDQHKDRPYIGIIYENGHDTGNFKFYKKGEI